MQAPFDIAADLDTPVSAFLKLEPLKPRFLLESVEGGERLARYSFLGFGDALEVRMDANGMTVDGEQRPRPTNQAEYLDALRQALERGLSVNEYAVSKLADRKAEADDIERDETTEAEAGESTTTSTTGRQVGKRVAGRTEKEVYEALGLPCIPPELRENRGEIEAAEKGRLPELITLDDMRGDLQMHSTWSDGKNSIEEMLKACAARGYEYFALTDHSKALAMTGGRDAEKLARQWEEIDEVVARHDEIRFLRSIDRRCCVSIRLLEQCQRFTQLRF